MHAAPARPRPTEGMAGAISILVNHVFYSLALSRKDTRPVVQ